MSTVTRPSGVRQEPFDAIPLSVQQRDDLTGNAKRLYGALSSAQRMGWEPTYVQLADRLGASSRSVVRWVQRLVDAGLIAVRRRGQGLPNLFRVLALVTSGRANQPAPAVTDGHRAPRDTFSKKKEAGKKVYTALDYAGSAARFANVHVPGGP